ncbi:MAG: DUF4870 domain-containing protein [Methanoregula sp.]
MSPNLFNYHCSSFIDWSEDMAVKATFGLDENVASAACYVLTWVTGIIFLLVEKDNKTVRFHAMQSVLTFLPLTILYYLLTSVVWWLFVGGDSYAAVGIWGILGLIGWLIVIVMFILWVVLMYKAYSGEKFLVPIVGGIAESQVR